MLKPFSPASTFVPAQLDGASWPALEPLYRALIDRAVSSPAELERLIIDRSELDAAASEAGSMAYIRMTCRTDDPSTKKAYLDYVQHVQPRLRETGFELDRKIVSSPHLPGLDQARYAVLIRDARAAVELYRPENVPLETELTELEQQYSEIAGAMTVSYRGEEMPLPKAARFQEETDRRVREETWRLVADRRLRDREKIDGIFDTMLAKRWQLARNAGLSDFRAYAFKARRRFDYTPEDCHRFAEGVERHVVPVARRLNRERARAMGLAALRPWDLMVDPRGRGPLRPFETSEQLVERTQRVFERMDGGAGGLASMFAALRDPAAPGGACLDLESRKGKAPGGYQSMRDRMRLPFIFMNAAGVSRDVETMVHEAGHAFHSLLCRDEPLLAYRSEIPLEFAEVASMSMELTTHPFLAEYYGNEADAARARRTHLEHVVSMLPWIATIDQFQHWLYTNPGHTRAARTAAWRGLIARFGAEVDWTGLEEPRDAMWQRQLHLFGAPFYYIEYGIAQLGAIQLYGLYQQDRGRALEGYKRGLSLGGSRPLPELFRAAGLDFDFSPERIGKTCATLERELAGTPG